MSTSTLSRPRTRRNGALVVVGPRAADRKQTAPTMPDWVQSWARLWGWQLRWYTEMGPGAAAAAAAPGLRALLLRPDTPTSAPHAGERRPNVVAALQDLPDDAAVVKDAVRCAAGCGAALIFVHAVPRSFGERSVDLDKALAHGVRLLEAAVRQATTQAGRLHAELVSSTQLLRVRPHELVGEELDADLLVIGGPRTEHGASERRGSVQPGG
ncbi:MAG: universal stress protein, partial [Pseudonocardia sp.]|nr:universal stress protein [Pseudonocardia sp.]